MSKFVLFDLGDSDVTMGFSVKNAAESIDYQPIFMFLTRVRTFLVFLYKKCNYISFHHYHLKCSVLPKPMHRKNVDFSGLPELQHYAKKEATDGVL